MLRKAASERVLYRMRTKTFTWRLLTGPELTEVYLNEMRRDFPAGELKPLSMILTSEAEGTAHTWGVFDGDTLAAYLLMVRPEGCRVSQLDYFAVVPAYRAHGIGAQLLAQLPESFNLYRKAICFQRTIEFRGLEPGEAAAQAAEPTHALELLSGAGAGELLDELSHLLEGFEKLVYILCGGFPFSPRWPLH